MTWSKTDHNEQRHDRQWAIDTDGALHTSEAIREANRFELARVCATVIWVPATRDCRVSVRLEDMQYDMPFFRELHLGICGGIATEQQLADLLEQLAGIAGRYAQFYVAAVRLYAGFDRPKTSEG